MYFYNKNKLCFYNKTQRYFNSLKVANTIPAGMPWSNDVETTLYQRL